MEQEKVLKIEEGGIWDFKGFEIILDHVFTTPPDCFSHRCRHVIDNKLKGIVVGYNEAGNADTGICLECIVEASKDILNK